VPQRGRVLSIVNPASAAILVHGFRSAEWSHPQPRSSGNVPSVTVWARPPALLRASRRVRETRPAASRLAAPKPAAPAPTTTTSKSSVPPQGIRAPFELIRQL